VWERGNHRGCGGGSVVECSSWTAGQHEWGVAAAGGGATEGRWAVGQLGSWVAAPFGVCSWIALNVKETACPPSSAGCPCVWAWPILWQPGHWRVGMEGFARDTAPLVRHFII